MLEADNLVLSQEPPVTAWQVLLVECGIDRTVQFFNLVAQGFENPSDNSIPPNVKFKSNGFSVLRNYGKVINHCFSLLQVNTIPDLLKIILGQRTVKLCLVDLFDIM